MSRLEYWLGSDSSRPPFPVIGRGAVAVLASKLGSVDSITLNGVLYPRADAKKAVDNLGRRWAAKGPPLATWQTILAEVISWLLGNHMKVPMPQASIYCPADDEPTWLSSYVDACMHFSPGRAFEFENYIDLARVLALDALIANGDRHAGNILMCNESMRIIAIDHDKALVGWPSDFISLGLGVSPPSVAHPGIPLFPEVRQEAMRVAASAATIGEAEIIGLVHEGCDLVRETSSRSSLADALVARIQAAPDLVDGYFRLLEGFAA